MNHGGLFSGVGGFDISFQRAGFEIAWGCEIEPAPRRIWQRHFPGLPLYQDVCKVNGSEIEPVDVLTFGSPCQDLSIAGKRAGMAGERSGLFFEATRIIREMRKATDGRYPAFALWENVPGALSSHAGRDFGAALDALADCGALDLAWRVLDAQFFGVAQRRRRVFTLADFTGERAGEVLFDGEGVRRNPAPRRQAGACVAAFTACGVGASGADAAQALAGHLIANALTAEGADASEDGSGRGTPLVFQSRYARNGRGKPDGIAPCLTGQAGESGKGDAAPLAFQPQASSTQPLTLAESSPALDQSKVPGILLGGIRRITPTEAERLQAFPDDWTAIGVDEQGRECPISDSARYRALGNAVTVTVALWLAKRMAGVLSITE